MSLNTKLDSNFHTTLSNIYQSSKNITSVYEYVLKARMFDFWISRDLYNDFDTLTNYSPGDGACLFHTEYLIARKKKEKILLEQDAVLIDQKAFAEEQLSNQSTNAEFKAYINNILAYLNAKKLEQEKTEEELITFTGMFGKQSWADSTMVKYFTNVPKLFFHPWNECTIKPAAMGQVTYDKLTYFSNDHGDNEYSSPLSPITIQNLLCSEMLGEAKTYTLTGNRLIISILLSFLFLLLLLLFRFYWQSYRRAFPSYNNQRFFSQDKTVKDTAYDNDLH